MDIIRSSESHSPVLTLLPFLTPIKRVLELGSGLSTKIFIDQKVYPDMEQFDCYDNGPENWIKACSKLLVDTDDRYQYHYLSMKMTEIVSKVDVNFYDLIFIDDSWECTDREATIANVTGCVKSESNTIIAIHDFDHSPYMESICGDFNQFAFCNVRPHVGILWKKTRLIPAVLGHYHKLIGIHYPKYVERWTEWHQFFIENKYQG